MKDSHKITIKINQQITASSLNKDAQPEMVTEWHVKRILVAVISLLFIILFVIYFFTRESVEKKVENTLEIKTTREPVNAKVNDATRNIKIEKIISIAEYNNSIKNKTEVNIQSFSSEILDPRVIRALLTKGINNKEPLGQIEMPLPVTMANATAVYYFTEIIDMKGQFLYHQWMWNKHEIYKRIIKIGGNRWRASTSKLIPYSKSGAWTVSLVNKEGIILNKIKFNVIKAQ
ncbi:MAG: DUF2914 domain-containing protein [Methylococcales bacterium]|nr:DUF2914 domain-containing protein [Methylococcales bacterium]